MVHESARHSARYRLLPLLGASAFLSIATRTAAQAALPIEASARVEAEALAATGRATLVLRFVATEALVTASAVRVELRMDGQLLQRRDHAPPRPMTEWKVAEPFEYELPLFFALPPATPGEVEVLVGFLDAATSKVAPMRGRAARRDGLTRLATFRYPVPTGAPDAASVAATIAAAKALQKRDARAAWDQLENAFRRSEDYKQKAALRDALLQVGRSEAAPLSFEEQGIVARRIRDERARYLRQVAGRLYDRGQLFGALVLLDEVGGGLQEEADRAVLGSLAEAQRVTKDRDEIAAKVFTATAEELAEAKVLAAKHGTRADGLAFAIELAKNPRRRTVARALLVEIEVAMDLKLQAAKARRELERTWLADVPADERKEADAALQHPCWARTTQRTSHRFVLIGPTKLLAGIPAESLLRFDLAYLYLTDLFGRVPNPEGDRVTVYFKELWDFGGGIGGGKIIDIGNADPDQRLLRVDGGLYYHELTHCVDDTKPIYPGLREGLADFGAAFAYHELRQVVAARFAFASAKRAFEEDYLARDLEYWRLPNYGPSAGFLLHFVSTYGKDGEDYAWQRYRRFFRAYRDDAVKDGRTPTLVRGLAFHLVAAFGEAAFEDLRRFRFPLLASDLAAIRLEQELAGAAVDKAAFFDEGDEGKGSPVSRDARASELARSKGQVDDHARELGVVRDWWVIGPFKKNGVDPDAYRFPPELEIDFAKEYESINHNPTWRRPGSKPVTVDASGWLRFHWSYMDDTAIYAVTHVSVETETEAWFHVRGDDDVTIFVGDRLVGKYSNIGQGLGPWRPDWRVQLPDAAKFRCKLPKGRTKVLLKIRNRGGESGATLAIARENGTPLPGWRSDAEPATPKLAAIAVPESKRWPSFFKAVAMSSSAASKLDNRVGKWHVRNKAIEGTATDRQVEWRKHTVRPGFPKDSPSNLAWLPARATEGVDEFRLDIDIAPKSPAPKLCVIVQGDGLRDGLGGWTLILDPQGETVQARLERYDRLVYESDRVSWEVDDKKPTRLSLVYYHKRLSVRLGEALLFDQAPLRPIPGRDRIGIATWGPTLRISAIEGRTPSRTR